MVESAVPVIAASLNGFVLNLRKQTTLVCLRICCSGKNPAFACFFPWEFVVTLRLAMVGPRAKHADVRQTY